MTASKEYEITCERCGKVFTYYHRGRKLCDGCREVAKHERDCRYYENHRDERRAARRAKLKADIPDTIICAVCGKEMPYKPRLKYCPECADRIIRERAMERYRQIVAAKKSEDRSTVCERCECFAWKDGKCTVLMETEPERCSFFKTKEQFEADARRSEERLKNK